MTVRPPADARERQAPASPTRRRAPWLPWVSLAARLGLAAVFATASLAKIGNVEAMVRAVRAYDLLPEGAVRPVAYTVPYLELALAVLLLLGLGTRLVAALSALLLVVFIGAVSSAGLRGLKIDCGCFGGGGAVAQTKYLQEIGRDVGFLVLAGWLLIFPMSRLSLDQLLSEDA